MQVDASEGSFTYEILYSLEMHLPGSLELFEYGEEELGSRDVPFMGGGGGTLLNSKLEVGDGSGRQNDENDKLK